MPDPSKPRGRGRVRPTSAQTPATGKDSTAASAAGALRLFNTLTRRIEPIDPLEPGHVRMYTCGPTVYRYIHIGNLRSFTMADWIRRALVFQGLRVTHIKNITDVGHMRQDLLDRGEDKLIAQARAEGKTPWDIARFYTEAFLADEANLRILPAHIFPRATDHLPEMIAMVERLLERGYAYEVDGNVFFAVNRFPAYGQLSGNLLAYLGQGMHTASETDPLKRAPEDFPLWKVAEEGRIMAWDSPWGRGFPGWHIECSAMSAKYLGPRFDLHTGGVDNIFPHHEDERAQSEAASGEQFVRYWVHGQHLLTDGLKMAKSTGNAYTLADVRARGFEPLALRAFFTTALYRSRINFTFTALRAAQTGLRRLRGRAADLARLADSTNVSLEEVRAHPHYAAFLMAVRADLNIPRATGVVWRMVKDSETAPALRLALLRTFDEVLGLGLADDVHVDDFPTAAARASAADERVGEAPAPEPVLALARERAALRAVGRYPAADALRERIAAAGFEVRDTRERWQLVSSAAREPWIASSQDVPSHLDELDTYGFSVALLARNNREDLERCLRGLARHAGRASVEVLIVDNGSTDDTLPYLEQLARQGAIGGLPMRVIFADHDLGFAAGRNAAFRACRGGIVVLLDTSIEVRGDIWQPLAALLSEPTVGVVGPFGLVTRDLKEYEESLGPDVDAVEGYFMAFRRALLREVGPAYEKFRFYRLMDVDYSLEFKRAGYRVMVDPHLAERVILHPHREWHSLSPEDQQTKSKKNFDIYWRRRHHSQSLLVASYVPGQSPPWGHDHEVAAGDADPRFEHAPLPKGAAHAHEHKHWPDHAHSHAHTHAPAARWHGAGAPTHYGGRPTSK